MNFVTFLSIRSTILIPGSSLIYPVDTATLCSSKDVTSNAKFGSLIGIVYLISPSAFVANNF